MIKQLIRKKILKLRKKNFKKSFTIKPDKIFKFLKKEGVKGKLVGGYYPYNFEVDTLEILKNLIGKKYEISLPKISKNNTMNFIKWSFNKPLLINNYGIPEPQEQTIVYPDILIVPLVAFDDHLNRLGYGGGYYDRYIAKVLKKKEVITIGLGYSFQKVEKLPYNENDIKLNYIITEKKIYK